jgi:hypothetical protein
MILVPMYCLMCKHVGDPIDEGKKLACRAYPKGIPKGIMVGDIEHLQVEKDQEGKYIFDPIRR